MTKDSEHFFKINLTGFLKICLFYITIIKNKLSLLICDAI